MGGGARDTAGGPSKGKLTACGREGGSLRGGKSGPGLEVWKGASQQEGKLRGTRTNTWGTPSGAKGRRSTVLGGAGELVARYRGVPGLIGRGKWAGILRGLCDIVGVPDSAWRGMRVPSQNRVQLASLIRAAPDPHTTQGDGANVIEKGASVVCSGSGLGGAEAASSVLGDERQTEHLDGVDHGDQSVASVTGGTVSIIRDYWHQEGLRSG